ncbi:DNA polymerase I [Paenibacillus sp. J31TS4]|uniref:DNA polymerase I n=1 Tax=Paenibacillus sp. J31TS4 TaxID=2807195 RepID=UPI001B1A077F|nr:DNA polymerase I [Paenibacillus sp. J31TS4]GIP38223.1 DNA polymerase I [Paenibacillus sp. J31TS4]
MSDKLIVIDGNSIANRAFYALPLLSNSGGLHTNAVYGFTTMLLKLLEDEQPSHFLVAFDAGKVVFRHQEYQDYKGGRAKTPSELSEQFPLIKELLRSFGIAQYELPGYEADDIIGTLTRLADEGKRDVLVVTGDKDMLQLASEHVTVLLTRKGISEVERFTPAHIEETYGLKPEQIIDLKGLMGDASDNIPGIPGVGEKTALKLLHEHGSVEQVLEHADKIKGKLGEKVREHEQDARMSKQLATIIRDVPAELSWDELKYDGYDGQSLKAMFQKLEFKSLLEKMDFGGAETGGEEGAEAEKLEVVAVSGEEELAALVGRLPHIAGVHVEAVGDNPHLADVLGVSMFDAEAATGYYVPVGMLRADAAAPLRRWLADPGVAKTLYDAHRAEVALAWQGIELGGAAFDVHLAAYLLDPTEASHSLAAVTAKHGLPALAEDESVFGKGARFKVPADDVLAEHLVRKAAAAARLAPVLEAELADNEMLSLLREVELPLSNVLADMEKQGIRCNADELKALGVELQERIGVVVERIYSLAGGEFNINSPKQLGEVLFDRLQLPVVKKTKTGYSTDAEVLEKLAPRHEIVADLLTFRQLAKLQSTYIEGLLKEVRPETGKIHTYYRQTIAATGRLSSQYPNLQNIPIRLEEGRKIRKVFVPSEPGWSILAADYSQIELRVLAHISQDERLMEAFHEDMDIHTKTAMDVFGVSEAEVDANMRRSAKAVNFGIVYGISDYGLSQNLDITRKEAALFIEQYFSIFRGVRKYMDDIVLKARQDGYVTTLLNRRRYLPDINASNFNLRSFAERTAMNTPIQGTAADIIKLAMVKIAERLKRDKLRSRMLLQVHDELVFEVPKEELELMQKLVPELMASALPLDVPLRADVSYGANWYEAK